MEDKEINVRLPAVLLNAVQQLAVVEDVSIGQIIRNALHHEVLRRGKAKTPVRADERLVGPLRALLADDFAYARDWKDLQSRLRQKGYRLAEAGGGLVLLDHDSGSRLCKGSELGYGYSQLLRKFDAPFPGHAHAFLLDRARSGT